MSKGVTFGRNKRLLDPQILEGFKNKTKSQVFKLLPIREEKGEWEKHLETTLIELYGVNEAFVTINFVRLIGKLEMLRYLDFKYYRKTVLECMTLIDTIEKEEYSNGGE